MLVTKYNEIEGKISCWTTQSLQAFEATKQFSKSKYFRLPQ